MLTFGNLVSACYTVSKVISLPLIGLRYIRAHALYRPLHTPFDPEHRWFELGDRYSLTDFSNRYIVILFAILESAIFDTFVDKTN